MGGWDANNPIHNGPDEGMRKRLMDYFSSAGVVVLSTPTPPEGVAPEDEGREGSERIRRFNSRETTHTFSSSCVQKADEGKYHTHNTKVKIKVGHTIN